MILMALTGCYDVPKTECVSSPDLSCPVHDAGSDAFDFWPFLLAVSPADATKDVPINVVLTVKFTEQVTGVTATSFTLTRQGDLDPVAAVVSYDPVTRTASLDPHAPLEPSTTYFAALGASIVDFEGHPLYGTRTWSFKTTHDMSAPTVTHVSPADGTSGVGVDTILVATFSEQVSHTTSGFFLEEVNGTVASTVGYVSQTAVKFTPLQQLAPFTLYTATLTSAITDLTGNALATTTWSFTTGADTVAPVVNGQTPDADDTDVSVSAAVRADFSEPVIGVSSASMTLEQAGSPIAATVTYLAASQTARLKPAAPLAPSTTYTVKLSTTITDASTNAIAPAMWSFTTAP